MTFLQKPLAWITPRLEKLHGRLMSRLRRHLGINVVRVFERELGQAARIESSCPSLECRVLSEAETEAHCGDAELELNQAFIRAAYANGGVCLGAFAEGRMVGYNWLAYSVTLIAEGVCVEFGPVFRYSYKSFVRPAYRGRRIVQALHYLADQPALRAGRTRAMNFVHTDNLSSIASLEHAGSRTVGYAAFVRCFGLVLSLSSAGAKRCGVRFCALRSKPRAGIRFGTRPAWRQ